MTALSAVNPLNEFMYKTFKIGAYNSTEYLLSQGEGNEVEFKSSFSLNIHTNKFRDKDVETASLKSLVGFLNTNGGNLLIGVGDDGSVCGIEQDRFESKDSYQRRIGEQFRLRIGGTFSEYIDYHFDMHEEKQVLKIAVKALPSGKYAYLD